jgi:hypothetical protein
MVELAARTIEAVAERVPTAELSRAFRRWSRVQAVHETLATLQRG